MGQFADTARALPNGQGVDVDRVRHIQQSHAARAALLLLEGAGREHQSHHRSVQRGTAIYHLCFGSDSLAR
jgi:negative regulator of sigma E activity